MRKICIMSMTVVSLLLVSSTVVFAQQPRRFPGLVFTLLDMEQTTQDLITEPPVEPLADAAEEQRLAEAESALSLQRATLLQVEENAGSYDLERMQALTDLAFSYQDLGDHEEAVILFEEALQLYRIRHGLDSVEQIQIIDAITESEKALQQFEQADNMESLAMHVVARTLPRGSDVLAQRRIRKASWDIEYFLRMQLYHHQSTRYRTGNSSIISYDNSGGSSAFGISPGRAFTFGFSDISAESLATSSDSFSSYSKKLTEAEELLNRALRNRTLTDKEKLENLKQLAAIQWYREVELYNLYYGYQTLSQEFLYLDSITAYNLERDFYDQGSRHLADALKVVKAMPDSTPTDIARSMLDLADWDKAFYEHREAEDKYAEVYEYLKNEELSDSEIQQIMNPSPLFKIPAFVVHQYELPWWQQEELSGIGQVEAIVTLRETGKIRGIDMSELSDPEESNYIRGMLRSYLQDGIFRPLIENGEPVEQDDLQLLFEYSY